MAELNWLITSRKYHSASLFLDNNYYPSSNALVAGTIGSGIICIIAIEEKELVFYHAKIKLSRNLGDIEKGDKLIGLSYEMIKHINISLTRRGTFNWRNPEYPNGRYVLDIEVILKDHLIYHFEADALTVLDVFVDKLRERNIEVVDRINLLEYLKPIKKDTKTIYDFIDKNYSDLARVYDLDNPRLKIEVD